MEDRTLYQTILGLSEPWAVERVELREAEQAVHVFVEATAGTSFTCPDCGTVVPVYDHAERRWRHWTPVNSRRSSWRACRGSSAGPMA